MGYFSWLFVLVAIDRQTILKVNQGPDYTQQHSSEQMLY